MPSSCPPRLGTDTGCTWDLHTAQELQLPHFACSSLGIQSHPFVLFSSDIKSLEVLCEAWPCHKKALNSIQSISKKAPVPELWCNAFTSDIDSRFLWFLLTYPHWLLNRTPTSLHKIYCNKRSYFCVIIVSSLFAGWSQVLTTNLIPKLPKHFCLV